MSRTNVFPKYRNGHPPQLFTCWLRRFQEVIDLTKSFEDMHATLTSCFECLKKNENTKIKEQRRTSMQQRKAGMTIVKRYCAPKNLMLYMFNEGILRDDATPKCTADIKGKSNIVQTLHPGEDAFDFSKPAVILLPANPEGHVEILAWRLMSLAESIGRGRVLKALDKCIHAVKDNPILGACTSAIPPSTLSTRPTAGSVGRLKRGHPRT